MHSVKRYRTHSFDDDLDNFTEYVYNGNISFCKSIFNGIINLICPCRFRKHKQLKPKKNDTV
jgi:hypothetical protein